MTLLRPLAFELIPRRVVAGLSAARGRGHRTTAQTRLQALVSSGEFDVNATASVVTASFDRAVFDLGGTEIVKAAWSELSSQPRSRVPCASTPTRRQRRLSEFRRLVPEWVREGVNGDTAWFSQQRANGMNAATQNHDVFFPLAVAAISVFHDRTAEQAIQASDEASGVPSTLQSKQSEPSAARSLQSCSNSRTGFTPSLEESERFTRPRSWRLRTNERVVKRHR